MKLHSSTITKVTLSKRTAFLYRALNVQVRCVSELRPGSAGSLYLDWYSWAECRADDEVLAEEVFGHLVRSSFHCNAYQEKVLKIQLMW